MTEKKKLLTKEHWLYIALFLLLMALLMVNATRYHGFNDENDNFLAGMSIVAGQNVFVEYTSQHMPLLYYICAVFDLLGAQNAFQFRLYFYVFFAILWVLFYVRNHKEHGRIASAAVPVLYVCNMYTLYTSSVLSDHLQAYGMAVLFFEFLGFCKTRIVDGKRSLWVAAAILLSFGSAFVSAFGIAVIVVGVLAIEALDRRGNGAKLSKNVLDITDKYKWLFVYAVTPFLLYIIVYAFMGYLDEMYFGMFRLNTEYYSKYMNGYGSSVLSAFVDPFVNYVTFIFRSISQFWEAKSATAKILACYLINITFLFRHFKKSKVETVILFCFMVLCGSRDFGFEFHAVPYYAVTVCMMGCLVQEGWQSLRKGTALKVITFLAFGFMIYPYAKTWLLIPQIPVEWQVRNEIQPGSYPYYLQLLTEPEEEVFLSTIQMDFLVDADRISFCTPMGTPWTYEGYEGVALDNIKKIQPRVAIYDPNYQLWGYYLKDYAKDVVAYMADNYRNLNIPGCYNLYVRNDYYEEALRKCGYPYAATFICENYEGLLPDLLNENFVAEVEVMQTIVGDGLKTDGLALMIGTYARRNDSHMMLEIVKQDTDEVVVSAKENISEWKDNCYNIIDFSSIVLEKGEMYEVKLTTDADAANAVIPYYTQDGNPETSVTVNGTEQEYDICYGLFQMIS